MISTTLALRLTFWYASVFSLSTVVAFLLIYVSIDSILSGNTDADLREDFEELYALYREKGRSALRDEINSEVASDGAEKVFYRMYDDQGREIVSSNLSSWKGLANYGELTARLQNRGTSIIESRRFPDHQHDSRVVIGRLPSNEVLQIGFSLEEDNRFMAVFERIFLLSLSLMLPLAGIAGWFMARKALQGVREVTAAAIDIADGKLDRRVQETGRDDELDLLARTFNTMLDRIQTLITGMRDMTDNIAHDLRSPLARIRGVAETTLLDDPDMDELRSVAANTIEECDRLLHMINTMLDITEVEAGTAVFDTEDVDLVELVQDAIELYQPLADDKNIALAFSVTDGANIKGNRQMLQRLFGNLLDNALKYTPVGGRVAVDVSRENRKVRISVRDTGIGIEKDEMGKIFLRFYRCDQSRTQSGTGLGLSLARAIARSHLGDLKVASDPGKGSDFWVELPA